VTARFTVPDSLCTNTILSNSAIKENIALFLSKTVLPLPNAGIHDAQVSNFVNSYSCVFETTFPISRPPVYQGTSQNVILIVEEKVALGCQYTATRLHDVKSRMY